VGNLGVYGRTILKWVLKKTGVRCALDLCSSLAGCCEPGNEPFGSIKDGKLLGYLSDCFSRWICSVGLVVTERLDQ
jgi:hypothetical protein